MQGGDDKTDRNGGKNSEHSSKDDDTFRSLLQRVDGDLNPGRVGGPDRGRKNSRGKNEDPATALLVAPETPQTDAAPLSDNIILLPREARARHLPASAGKTELVPPRGGTRARQWYHNNWTVIFVSFLVAVAVCLPLVFMLSYSLQWGQSDRRLPDNEATLLPTKELFSRPPPGQLTDLASKAETSATPAGNSRWSRRPVAADATAAPRLLDRPRLAKQPAAVAQSQGMPSPAQSENLPRIILPPQIILLAGPAGKPASLGLEFAPFALLPKGSFVVISGLPSQIELPGGTRRAEAWTLSSGSVAAVALHGAKASAGNFEFHAALMTPGGKEISHATATLLVVTPKQELRLGLAPPGAFQPPINERGAGRDVQALLNRGRVLINSGDIANARALLQAAAQRGSAAAALALAETYDPNQLTGPPEPGIVVDAAKARKWYLKALGLGGTAGLGARLKALPRK